MGILENATNASDAIGGIAGVQNTNRNVPATASVGLITSANLSGTFARRHYDKAR